MIAYFGEKIAKLISDSWNQQVVTELIKSRLDLIKIFRR